MALDVLPALPAIPLIRQPQPPPSVVVLPLPASGFDAPASSRPLPASSWPWLVPESTDPASTPASRLFDGDQGLVPRGGIVLVMSAIFPQRLASAARCAPATKGVTPDSNAPMSGAEPEYPSVIPSMIAPWSTAQAGTSVPENRQFAL